MRVAENFLRAFQQLNTNLMSSLRIWKGSFYHSDESLFRLKLIKKKHGIIHIWRSTKLYRVSGQGRGIRHDEINSYMTLSSLILIIYSQIYGFK